MGAENRFPFLNPTPSPILGKAAACISSKGRWIVLILSMLLNSSCGGNFFESMSGQTSHDAIIEEIRILVNKLQFDEAIELFEESTSLVVENRQEKLLIASAYAGACGVTFAEIFESLENAAGSPMLFMMSAFTTKIIQPAHCYSAQQWIEKIGTAANRTTNENIAMFLVGFGKVGTYLRSRADTSATGVGDGTVDGTFDSCDNTDLPVADVKQVVSGFGLMIENISALGTNVSGDLSGDLAGINAICTGLGLACTQTNPTLITDADADDFRNAIKSDSTTQIGIEDCDPLSPACCP